MSLADALEQASGDLGGDHALSALNRLDTGAVGKNEVHQHDVGRRSSTVRMPASAVAASPTTCIRAASSAWRTELRISSWSSIKTTVAKPRLGGAGLRPLAKPWPGWVCQCPEPTGAYGKAAALRCSQAIRRESASAASRGSERVRFRQEARKSAMSSVRGNASREDASGASDSEPARAGLSMRPPADSS